nr:MAG TPA: hypothetical protein [Caudoviricetes sp.]
MFSRASPKALHSLCRIFQARRTVQNFQTI